MDGLGAVCAGNIRIGAADIDPAVVMDAAHVQLHFTSHGLIGNDDKNAPIRQPGAGRFQQFGISPQQDNVIDLLDGWARRVVDIDHFDAEGGGLFAQFGFERRRYIGQHQVIRMGSGVHSSAECVGARIVGITGRESWASLPTIQAVPPFFNPVRYSRP